MALAGDGAVAIWHDITPEGRQQFYAWHGTEHMPERVAIPGFLRGRRYIAVRAELEFFNLYEARSPQVLTGPDYLHRLNNPTPWTTATVKHFRRVARSLCRVAATFGGGQGGLISTWRYDVAAADADSHIDALTQTILPRLMDDASVAGAHLLVADTEASAVDTVERAARGEKNLIPRWVLLVEGWGDQASFVEVCRSVLSDDALASAGAAGAAELGLYQLQAQATASSVASA
ncbi:MAG: hypothetical protein ACR2RB_06475 [Gammaproteobacteria bacterium]